MDEPKEKKSEEKEPEKPAGDTDEGDKPKTTTLIDDANLAAKRLEDANKEKKELLNREEQLMAKGRLGGVTETGQAKTPKFSDEEKASRARIKAIGDATGSAWAKNYE